MSSVVKVTMIIFMRGLRVIYHERMSPSGDSFYVSFRASSPAASLSVFRNPGPSVRPSVHQSVRPSVRTRGFWRAPVEFEGAGSLVGREGGVHFHELTTMRTL